MQNIQKFKHEEIDLFLELGLIYGKKWIDFWNNDHILMTVAEAKWKNSLSEFTNEQIMSGIRSCESEYENPPTLPQLKKLCAIECTPNYFSQFKNEEQIQMTKEQKQNADKIIETIKGMKHKILKSMEE